MVYEYQKNADGHYVCNHCNVVKVRQNTMHYHLKTHADKLPFECSICKKAFLHASTLELHKKAQHETEIQKLFKCPVVNCPFEGTLTKSNLIIHYVRKHCKVEAAKSLAKQESGAYKCVHCDKESKSLTAFHYHIINCITIADPARNAQFNALKA